MAGVDVRRILTCGLFAGLVNLMALSLPLLVAVTMIAAWSYERAARQMLAQARESLQ
jgi:hypothetical protein